MPMAMTEAATVPETGAKECVEAANDNGGGQPLPDPSNGGGDFPDPGTGEAFGTAASGG